MLEVDTKHLKIEINKINSDIDNYEETILNLFLNLNNSCTFDWKDNNALKFKDKIYLEKQEIENYIELLKSKKNIYDYIYYQYSQFGELLKIDTTNNTNMINKINSFIDSCDVIINQFNLITDQSECCEHKNIIAERDRMNNVKNKLLFIREKYQSAQRKINEIEINVKNMIDNLEIIKILDFKINEENKD